MVRGLKAKSPGKAEGLWVLLAKHTWQVNISRFRAVSAHHAVQLTEQPYLSARAVVYLGADLSAKFMVAATQNILPFTCCTQPRTSRAFTG